MTTFEKRIDLAARLLVGGTLFAFGATLGSGFLCSAEADDQLRHKARDFETEEAPAAPAKAPRSQSPRPKFVFPEDPNGESTSGEIHFYNNANLASQDLSSIPGETSLSIVNGSSVSAPIIRSRTYTYQVNGTTLAAAPAEASAAETDTAGLR